MMRKFFIIILTILAVGAAWAQGGKSTFDYLLLPHSARSSAVGGVNLSVIENDASLIYDNPAFLGYEMDKTLLVSYLSYIADIGVGNVTFTKKLGDRSSIGVGALYANYGKMLETTVENIVVGDLNAIDVCGTVFFAHDITSKLRGGITAKFLYSNYYHNTAIGLGVDLGLSYYSEASGFSWGLVGKNLGRQIKAYNEELYALPWDIRLGVTQKFLHAPVRFSITAINLKQWKFDDIYSQGDSFFKTAWKHLTLGVEFIPSDNFWVGVGYNVKRGSDMFLENGGRLNGFSAGFGLRVIGFNISCAIGKYNTSATSFMLSLATSFTDKGL
ncbi:MAG: type IX secretion system protein PorQ [Dysgonamonadaceae bacterium]|nr:type IX secretion system protein PorQ [Dysgonamonadaceae bacterium]